MHDTLHWLDFPQRITYKLALLVYKCLHGLAPEYLTRACDLLSTLSGRPHLRSSEDNKTFCTEIAHCFHGLSSVLFIRPYLVEHSSSSATALITDTRTVQVFAQGVIVCLTVTARALVTVLCYLCVLKCLFIIIIISIMFVKNTWALGVWIRPGSGSPVLPCHIRVASIYRQFVIFLVYHHHHHHCSSAVCSDAAARLVLQLPRYSPVSAAIRGTLHWLSFPLHLQAVSHDTQVSLSTDSRRHGRVTVCRWLLFAVAVNYIQQHLRLLSGYSQSWSLGRRPGTPFLPSSETLFSVDRLVNCDARHCDSFC